VARWRLSTGEAVERYDRHSHKKSPAYPSLTIAKFMIAEFRRAMVLSSENIILKSGRRWTKTPRITSA
jgi:hypothetical protein